MKKNIEDSTLKVKAKDRRRSSTGKKPLEPPPVSKRPRQSSNNHPASPTFLSGKGTALSVAFRHFKPNWRLRYIQLVRHAARQGDEKMQTYIRCFDSLQPFEQRFHYPETVLDLCGVAPEDLVGAVCRASWATLGAESNMISAIAHPEVLQSVVRFAKSAPENFKHAEMFFKMTGSLPDKKGALMNVHFNNAAAVVSDGGRNAIGGSQLMSMDDDVIDMNRQLESGGGQVLQMPPFSPAEAVEVGVESTADDDD